MTDLKIVFDGYLGPDFISESQSFSNCKYLFFALLGGLSDSEYIEFGAMLEVSIPTIDGIQQKLYPFSSGLVDTDYLYFIPAEIADTDYSCKLYLNSSFSFSLRVYTIISSITLSVISNELKILRQEIQHGILGERSIGGFLL